MQHRSPAGSRRLKLCWLVSLPSSVEASWHADLPNHRTTLSNLAKFQVVLQRRTYTCDIAVYSNPWLRSGDTTSKAGTTPSWTRRNIGISALLMISANRFNRQLESCIDKCLLHACLPTTEYLHRLAVIIAFSTLSVV